jgi:hypothetical protein
MWSCNCAARKLPTYTVRWDSHNRIFVLSIVSNARVGSAGPVQKLQEGVYEPVSASSQLQHQAPLPLPLLATHRDTRSSTPCNLPHSSSPSCPSSSQPPPAYLPHPPPTPRPKKQQIMARMSVRTFPSHPKHLFQTPSLTY